MEGKEYSKFMEGFQLYQRAQKLPHNEVVSNLLKEETKSEIRNYLNETKEYKDKNLRWLREALRNLHYVLSSLFDNNTNE